MCYHVFMTMYFFTFVSAFPASKALNPTPIGCSSTLTAMPLAKPASKKTMQGSKKTMQAIKAMKVAMKAMKTMKAMKAPKSTGQSMKTKEEKDAKKGLAMKKGSRPVEGFQPDYVLHHLAIKCANPTCKSWVWLRRTDQLTRCQMCNTIHGCHMRQ